MDAELQALADAAGIETRWRDVQGQVRDVGPDAQRALLGALGLPAGSAAQIAESQAALAAPATRPPPLLTVACGPDGAAIPAVKPGHNFRVSWEHGGHWEGKLDAGWGGEARLPAVAHPGYHRLELDDIELIVAAAPPRCPSLADLQAATHQGARAWALAVQSYALRRPGDLGVGDFTAVAEFAEAAARHGAVALAISPGHALFGADPDNYGPYAPSSRLFRNVLLADPAAVLSELPPAGPDGDQTGLIDWPAAARAKYARLRALFRTARDDPRFVAYRSQAGHALEDHARFEALHGHFFGTDPALWNWRDWPAEYRTPASPGVLAFAREHPGEVAFHAFCQWIADESAAVAQGRARGAGMPIGLIADLAVGTDGGGSHAWSRQRAILNGVTVGAPPDIFSPLGQGWGLTAFSPRELAAGGFTAFIELLHASLRHAGGVRIDHAMGLRRLWLVPDGAGPADGAYLRYPLADQFRLLALEAHRHRALVIGEDLGTLPDGFAGDMARAGLLGMSVLWFEQSPDGAFKPPQHWAPGAAGMTTTHDLPTVVGWWRGNDIDWRERLALFPSAEAAQAERVRRTADRAALWRAFQASGAASGDPPDAKEAADGEAVADAAMFHLGRAASALAILPVEDALALPEQPNMPGTIDTHPNWRRSLPGPATTLLDAPAVKARLARLAEARRA